MKQNSILFLLGSIIVSCTFLLFFLLVPGNSRISAENRDEKTSKRLFPYQCIDTMKVSRDKAREYLNDPSVDEIIETQVDQVAMLGANCIALGTPYEREFIPYLTKWVNAARRHHLRVWFRGNLASWEGWFDYPKSTSLEVHTSGVVSFIRSNPTLFQNGDIFSGYVEPENGGPFAPVDSAEKTKVLRNHIATEQRAVKLAFRDIGKEVSTHWISMSGGVAKSVIDDTTRTALQDTVTLDHYVADAHGMTEFIDFFSPDGKTKIVLGEFGAPIPDINGEMNEKNQADFVNSLLDVLYRKRNSIAGVNYWTLTESSTALLNDAGELKPVGTVIKKYYLPAEIRINVTDRSNAPLPDIPVYLDRTDTGRRTDSKGNALLLVPQGKYKVAVNHPDGTVIAVDITAGEQEVIDITARFVPEFRLFLPIRNFLENF